jgi:hypothetical protein
MPPEVTAMRHGSIRSARTSSTADFRRTFGTIFDRTSSSNVMPLRHFVAGCGTSGGSMRIVGGRAAAGTFDASAMLRTDVMNQVMHNKGK